MITRLVCGIFLATLSTSSAGSGTISRGSSGGAGSSGVGGGGGDLLSEIQSALANLEDVSHVLDYLKQSEEQLKEDLPSGEHPSSFLFFLDGLFFFSVVSFAYLTSSSGIV